MGRARRLTTEEKAILNHLLMRATRELVASESWAPNNPYTKLLRLLRWDRFSVEDLADGEVGAPKRSGESHEVPEVLSPSPESSGRTGGGARSYSGRGTYIQVGGGDRPRRRVADVVPDLPEAFSLPDPVADADTPEGL